MDGILMKFVIAFAPLFSKPVFERVKVLVTGAILSPAARTVTNALRVMGLSEEKHFQQFHRVLSRSRWSGLRGSKILLTLLLKAFGVGDEVSSGLTTIWKEDAAKRSTPKESIGMRCARRNRFSLKRADCVGCLLCC